MSSQDKPYKDICSHGCWYAKKNPCKCKCKGVHHQRGYRLQELANVVGDNSDDIAAEDPAEAETKDN